MDSTDPAASPRPGIERRDGHIRVPLLLSIYFCSFQINGSKKKFRPGIDDGKGPRGGLPRVDRALMFAFSDPFA